MQISENGQSRIMPYLLLAGLVAAAPVPAETNEYPPAPPPKGTKPFVPAAKPQMRKPPARPPKKTEAEQPAAPALPPAKPSTAPPAQGKPASSAPHYMLKRKLPAAGTRIIRAKTPERERTADRSGPPAMIKSVGTTRLLPNVRQYFKDKYRTILDVTSTLRETPNGPAGSLKLEGNFLPEQAYGISEEDRNRRAEAIANAFLEEEAAFLGITDRSELRRSGRTPGGSPGDAPLHIDYFRFINDAQVDHYMIHLEIGPDDTIHKINAHLVPSPPEMYEAAAKETLNGDAIREIMERDLATAETTAKNIRAKAIVKLAKPAPPYITWQGLAGADLDAGHGSWEYRINAFTGEIIEKRSGTIHPGK